jgi:hypothetical protein
MFALRNYLSICLYINPMEESFAALKRWIKKNRTLAEECQSFEEFLRIGLELLATKRAIIFAEHS